MKNGFDSILNIVKHLPVDVFMRVTEFNILLFTACMYYNPLIGVQSNAFCLVQPFKNWFLIPEAGGSSSIKCSDTYMGPEPASTIEVSDMQDHVLSIKDRVKVFMDVHAYSQYWMYPYGYSNDIRPVDDEELVSSNIWWLNPLCRQHKEGDIDITLKL